MVLTGSKIKIRGFTLVELLVAIGLSTMFAGVVMSLYLVSRQSLEIGNASSEIHASARLAMDWMSKDIRWGKRIRASRLVGTQTYTTGDSELILEIPSIDANENIIDINTTFDYIIYHRDGSDPTQLQRIRSGW